MYSKKTSLFKAFTAVVKRLFRARNVIIISEHKVDHVPLSGTMQVLILVGLLGFFSGISYITGSYMSARSALKDKEQKIVSTTLEKTRIGEEMSILKRDLVKLGQNGKELSAYNKFIIEQYSSEPRDSRFTISPTDLSAENIFGQNNSKLADRITYLEARISEIRDENDHLVTAIRERTDKKIAYFEDIITMTGLDAERLEHEHAAATADSASKHADNTASHLPLPEAAQATGSVHLTPEPTVDADPNDDTAKKESRAHENQGGPFIPADVSSFNDADRELLANVDRLVLLHDIVEQLPIRSPIADAQVTGPFGKRLDPLNHRWAIHPGVDLAGPAGSHIFSASAGRIITAGRKAAYGNAVDIDHGFGIVTRYAHMSQVLVHEGQYVRKGQLIGIQGSTGRSTGPHLHFEVRINDRPVNPVKFLHAGEYVLEN